MWKTTLKGLFAHRVRLAMTALAVVLGVGFVAGTFVYTDTITRVFDDLVTDSTSGFDLYVRGEAAFTNIGNGQTSERQTIPEAVLADVQAVDGVAVADPSVEGYAQIVDKQGEAITPMGPPTLGASWTPPPGGQFTLREGDAPQRPDEVVVDAGTAAGNDLTVGDEVRVLFSEVDPRSFEIVGIAGFGEADNLAGATLALFDLDTAQEVLGHEGEFTSIQVAVDEGASVTGVRNAIGEVLPSGVEVATTEAVAAETTDAISSALGFLQTALLIFGLIALFVGAFIIANTFTIVVAQRTREFALLRALGASDRQILTSVLGEAALVGLAGSALGILAGVGLAAGLRSLMSTFGFDMPSGDLVVLPRTIVVGLVVGVVVTVASSFLPARRAGRIEPVAAMRLAATPASPSSRARTFAGAGSLAAGVGLLAFALLASPDNSAVYVGLAALLTLLGVGGLAPLVVRPVASVLGAPAARLDVAGGLARRNAGRSPRRTAATASALMIGLALVSFTAVLASSLKASAAAGIDEQLKADFVVTSANAFAGGGFSPQVTERIRSLPEIGATSVLRSGQAQIEGSVTFLAAVDPGTWSEVAATSFAEGSAADLAESGTIMVDRDYATANDVAVGDEVTAEFAATGERELTVAAIYESDPLLSGGWITSVETFEGNFAEAFDMVVLANAAAGTPSTEVSAALDTVVEEFPNVTVENQAEYKATVAGQVDQMLALVTALLGMAIIIAVLGIANTLALSVHERTREIGLLRAVGMTRRQARSMIRWEAVIVSVLGALLGLTVGGLFGWAIVQSLASEGIDEFVLPGGQLTVYVVLSGVAGVLAAVFPARRAAKLDVLEAIVTE